MAEPPVKEQQSQTTDKIKKISGIQWYKKANLLHLLHYAYAQNCELWTGNKKIEIWHAILKSKRLYDNKNQVSLDIVACQVPEIKKQSNSAEFLTIARFWFECLYGKEKFW